MHPARLASIRPRLTILEVTVVLVDVVNANFDRLLVVAVSRCFVAIFGAGFLLVAF